MKCEHCGKEIYGMTGFQEIQKYQSHLRKCKKNKKTLAYGKKVVAFDELTNPDCLQDCLESRIKSERKEDGKVS